MPTRSTLVGADARRHLGEVARSSLLTRTTRPGWWTNVFSCRNITVSLPTSKARSPAPIVTSLMGGADAASSAVLASSLT